MKTKDLCQLFDLPRSAVRFYRNASLFSLQQDENGYFHYEVEEIAALYEVLKHRRKHDLSLEAITQRLKNQSNHSDNEEMINLFQNQIDALEQEIQTLRRKQQGIKQSLTYQKLIQSAYNQIQYVEDCDGLSNIKESEFHDHLPALHELLESDLSYQSLVFSYEELEKETFRPTYAIGITHHNQNRAKLASSFPHCIAPHQRGLRFILALSSLQQLDSAVFVPVQEYIREHHLKVTEEVTSIILKTESIPSYRFVVLFRFIVADKEPDKAG